jgi:cbb3-type cytochrome oxidase subunit 3
MLPSLDPILFMGIIFYYFYPKKRRAAARSSLTLLFCVWYFYSLKFKGRNGKAARDLAKRKKEDLNEKENWIIPARYIADSFDPVLFLLLQE